MKAQTIGWFIFLALIKNFSHAQQKLFSLVDSQLTATEGSCAEIKCRVTSYVDDFGAYWFWMKNANWTGDKYTATIIYSTNDSLRPVSPDFAERVTYVGTASSSWKVSDQQRLCSILICNLTKADSGNYSFRFIGSKKEQKWATQPPLVLTVKENPCPITFDPPPVANENNQIRLTCSTLSSCSLNLEIKSLTEWPTTNLPTSQEPVKTQKSTTVSFTADWQDDGKEFSCQTKDNKDKYLIKKINVTVEYAPKDTSAKISPTDVIEGKSVTLTCSAIGRPDPTFTWFKKEQVSGATGVSSEAEWVIQSIEISQGGEYYCEARNKHGTIKSNAVSIEVTYVPEVDIKMTSPASRVYQGDKISLTCNLMRSNPPPHTYNWLKDGSDISTGSGSPIHDFERIRPEDSGSYTCRAINTAGPGTSQSLQISVLYSPRRTNINSQSGRGVKIDTSLTFHCDTDANPSPEKYSWYRYNKNKEIGSSQWTSKTTDVNKLHLERVQRTDEACYTCNATNEINTGDSSEPACINVLYPPTNLLLSMDTDVTEGQPITITCTAESFPTSQLELKRTDTSSPYSSEVCVSQSDEFNSLKETFNVTSTHAGFYICVAKNTEGSKKSIQRELVVNYRPKDVTVKAQPGLIVTENTSLTLECRAQSHPAVTSVTWMKMSDGKTETILGNGIIKVIKSVNSSDSGLYRCEATNQIGTRSSTHAEVKVKYAPKHTEITMAAEKQHPDGRLSVMLSCSSHSYPPVTEYSWYRKTEAEKRDMKISIRQNHTVYSDQPGVYYCIAKNEINQRLSDPIPLFVYRDLMKVLKYFFLFLIMLLVVVLIPFFVYRNKRNKSARQRTTNTSPCFGFLGWWNCVRRRNLMNQPVMQEPFRSRDDLLPDQPYRLNGQQRQPRPDSTPASNINSVYCTVNLPAGKQGPSAQKPVRQQGGHKEDVSLNYASLHFENKQKNTGANAEENTVYAVVSKQKPLKKNERERLEDYENISAAHAAKPPNPLSSDSDTSEDDEVELNYSRVSFKAKPGHQRARRDSSSDSSTSDEEETQYSDIKI